MFKYNFFFNFCKLLINHLKYLFYRIFVSVIKFDFAKPAFNRVKCNFYVLNSHNNYMYLWTSVYFGDVFLKNSGWNRHFLWRRFCHT